MPDDTKVYMEYIGENEDNKGGYSEKFHQLWVSFGGYLHHRYGKIGTKGQYRNKKYPTVHEAIAALNKIKADKTSEKKKTRYVVKPCPLPYA